MIDLTEIYDLGEPAWTWERVHGFCGFAVYSIEGFCSFAARVMPDQWAYADDGIYLVEAGK